MHSLPGIQHTRILLSATVIAASIFFFFGGTVYARVTQKEVWREYRAILGREPTVTERQDSNVLKGALQDLRKKLSGLPERRRTITTLYQQFLLRRPRPNELAAWVKDAVPLASIQAGILALPERQTLMDDLYLAYFGRYPNDHERASNSRRGVSYEKLREALKTGDERRTAIIDRFGQMLGRSPDDTELTFFLTTGQSLDVIGQNTPPVAVAGDDLMIANDTSIVTLDGSKSTDLEGTVLTYTWKVLETPPDTTVILSDATVMRPSFSVPVDADDPLYHQDGIYRFQLVVSDGQTKSAPDEVEVHVRMETSFESQLLDLVNQTRKGDGSDGSAPSLVAQSALVHVARKYSRALFVYGWFESVDPAGRGPADRARGEGYAFKRIGENIALIKSKTAIRLNEKRVQDMFNGWIASGEHKKNLMKADFVETGVGFFGGKFATSDYRIYAVQMFAVPKPETPPEPPKVPEIPKVPDSLKSVELPSPSSTPPAVVPPGAPPSTTK